MIEGNRQQISRFPSGRSNYWDGPIIGLGSFQSIRGKRKASLLAPGLAAMNPELRTFIDVGDGATLEAAITPPGPSSARLAVVCHPWGKLGGCMDDGVVRTIARALAADGVGTCRFNFRGVGASSGSSGYTGGQGAGKIGSLTSCFAFACPFFDASLLQVRPTSAT